MQDKLEQGKTTDSGSELVGGGALSINKGNSWAVESFNSMRNWWISYGYYTLLSPIFFIIA